MANRMIALALIAGVMLSVMFLGIGAVTGVENLTLSRYSANIASGTDLSINFTLTKVSGYSTFATTFWVPDSTALAKNDNITIILSPNYGNPTAKGVLHILTDHTAIPGVYDIVLKGNSTNVTVNPATFVLDIGSTTTTSTVSTVYTVPTTTALQSKNNPTTIITTVPATLVPVYGTANSGINTYTFAIVVIIVAIVAFLAGRMTKGDGNAGKEQQKQQEKKS